MPKNAATQRRYSGINVLILWGAVVQHGFPGQSWLTFRQALSLGGNVRKGERGTTVVFADRFVPDQERVRAREQGDEPNAIPFLKRFTVFNVTPCDGLSADLVTVPPPVPDGLIIIGTEGSASPPSWSPPARPRRCSSGSPPPGSSWPPAAT
jgi:antirestriction protein ArdC